MSYYVNWAKLLICMHVDRTSEHSKKEKKIVIFFPELCTLNVENLLFFTL